MEVRNRSGQSELSMIRWPPRQRTPLVLQYDRTSSSGAGGNELPAPAHSARPRKNGRSVLQKCGVFYVLGPLCGWVWVLAATGKGK